MLRMKGDCEGGVSNMRGKGLEPTVYDCVRPLDLSVIGSSFRIGKKDSASIRE